MIAMTPPDPRPSGTNRLQPGCAHRQTAPQLTTAAATHASSHASEQQPTSRSQTQFLTSDTAHAPAEPAAQQLDTLAALTSRGSRFVAHPGSPRSHTTRSSRSPSPRREHATVVVASQVSLHTLRVPDDPHTAGTPGSHSSPASSSPLPQPVRVHHGVHPSLARVLPSSQASRPSCTPSPQNDVNARQSRHGPKSPSLTPSSHSSPGPTIASPQPTGRSAVSSSRKVDPTPESSDRVFDRNTSDTNVSGSTVQFTAARTARVTDTTRCTQRVMRTRRGRGWRDM